jgi:hypothetical protein
VTIDSTGRPSADDSSLFPTVRRPHDSVGVVGVSFVSPHSCVGA